MTLSLVALSLSFSEHTIDGGNETVSGVFGNNGGFIEMFADAIEWPPVSR